MTQLSGKDFSAKIVDYDEPPVIEVVCGVTFPPVSFSAPDLGLFWTTIRKEYPHCKELAPLAQVFEATGEAPPSQTYQITDVPPLPRVWFFDEHEEKLIQVQRDRFLYNWKDSKKTGKYPSFYKIYQKYEEELNRFKSFLHQEGFEIVNAIQYELTYLNHIAFGQGWLDPTSLGATFPDFQWRRGERFLTEIEGVNWSTAFRLPEKFGRLHISIRTGVRKEDSQPIVVLNLTARGLNANGEFSQMSRWFKVAHDWIVQAFSDITDRTVQQKHWRRTK